MHVSTREPSLLSGPLSLRKLATGDTSFVRTRLQLVFVNFDRERTGLSLKFSETRMLVSPGYVDGADGSCGAHHKYGGIYFGGRPDVVDRRRGRT